MDGKVYIVTIFYKDVKIENDKKIGHKLLPLSYGHSFFC